MQSLSIRHVTTYRYRQPVAFGEGPPVARLGRDKLDGATLWTVVRRELHCGARPCLLRPELGAGGRWIRTLGPPLGDDGCRHTRFDRSGIETVRCSSVLEVPWTARSRAVDVNRVQFLAHPDSALSDWNNSEIGEPRRISSACSRDPHFPRNSL